MSFTYKGALYVGAGNKAGMFYMLRLDANGRNPRLAWKRQLAIGDNGKNGGGIFMPPAYSNGLVYEAGGPPPDKSCRFGALYALQPDTGKVAWQVCTHGISRIFSPPAVAGDVLLTAETNNTVAYDQATGKILWMQSSQTAWGGVAVSRGYVLVPSVPGQLTVYSLPPGTPTKAAG